MQLEGRLFTTEERKNGNANGNRNRRSPVTDVVQMQDVLKSIVMGKMRQVDKRGEVIDVPAREIASCAVAWDRLEDRRRELLGKPRMGPLKVEPKRRTSSRSDRLRIEPIESDMMVAPVPVEVTEPK